MPTRPLFTITSILVVGLGLAWLVVPEQMLLSWGATPDQTLVYMSRRYAVLFFGYGAMLWGSRSAAPSGSAYPSPNAHALPATEANKLAQSETAYFRV